MRRLAEHSVETSDSGQSPLGSSSQALSRTRSVLSFPYPHRTSVQPRLSAGQIPSFPLLSLTPSQIIDSRPPPERIVKAHCHKGSEIVPSELCPLVAASDRLWCWTGPASVSHQSDLEGQLSAPAIRKLNKVLLSSWVHDTKTSYGAGLLRFMQFCDRECILEKHRMPASKILLAGFAADAAGTVLGNCISSWFSGLAAWHIVNGSEWHGDDSFVKKVKRGAAKLAPSSLTREQRPPVTIEHMLVLFHALDFLKHFDCAVWAVATCAFWGCCRLGELTIKSANLFDPSFHVSRSVTICFQNNISPSGVKESVHFHIPWTKSTREKGADLSITGDDIICPGKATHQHLTINSECPPNSLSCGWFLDRCHGIWRSAGLLLPLGHSFRIGGASELLLAGIPPEVVATIGRWKSLAFLLYWRKIEEILPRSFSRSYDSSRIRELAVAFENFRVAQNIPENVLIQAE
ncbi:DNA breaking-rejoining enzyme [Mycena floridula]|nr:DNA breaking-rejoining enzyme [Mycena floridula]